MRLIVLEPVNIPPNSFLMIFIFLFDPLLDLFMIYFNIFQSLFQDIFFEPHATITWERGIAHGFGFWVNRWSLTCVELLSHNKWATVYLLQVLRWAANRDISDNFCKVGRFQGLYTSVYCVWVYLRLLRTFLVLATLQYKLWTIVLLWAIQRNFMRFRLFSLRTNAMKHLSLFFLWSFRTVINSCKNLFFWPLFWNLFKSRAWRYWFIIKLFT